MTRELLDMEEVVTFRTATKADASAIRDLTREASAKWIPEIGREPKPMTADYQAATHNHRVELLYIGHTLAALIQTIDQGDRLLIENVAVRPAHQRQGLGSKLIAHAEEIAALHGYNKIWLYTNMKFEGNVELYSRLGYRTDSEEQLGDGLVRINMSKNIASAQADRLS